MRQIVADSDQYDNAHRGHENDSPMGCVRIDYSGSFTPTTGVSELRERHGYLFSFLGRPNKHRERRFDCVTAQVMDVNVVSHCAFDANLVFFPVLLSR